MTDDPPSPTAELADLLKEVSAGVSRMESHLVAGSISRTARELDELRVRVVTSTPGNPAAQGWSSYAQCDEDGIIRECLFRINRSEALSNTFVEIGCGNGLENNTHQLLLDGYRGGWLDGDPKNFAFITDWLGPLLATSDRLSVRNTFIDVENMAVEVGAFVAFLGTPDFDLFSLDTDGNDVLLVQESLKVCRPKLLCVEYNAKFRPPTRLTISYNPDHQWVGDDYFGGSLQSWVDGLDGYTLVCCNLSGANAFFVRDDLLAGFDDYSVDQLYQPPRYWLAGRPGGHPSGFRWLRQALLTAQ